MTQDNDNNPFTYFDDIVCINIDKNTVRREGTKELFDKLGISGRFHVVSKHPKGGMYGCFDSHIQVIQEAYAKKLSNILIFEDDIKITPSYSKRMVDKCVTFMKERNDWDLFYLGYFPVSDYNIQSFFQANFIDDNIIEFSPFATHAYVISRQGMEKVLGSYHDFIGKKHYDYFLSDLKLKSYCVIPFLFDQMFCLGTDNKANNTIETIMRKFQCTAEQHSLMYKPTLFKYTLHKHKQQCMKNITTLSTVIIILAVATIFFISKKV